MFSIKKWRKIQIFYFIFSNPNTAQIGDIIDSNRTTECEDLSTRINNKIKITQDIKHTQEIEQYISDPFLKRYFQQFPSAWSSLKRKLHKYRSYKESRYFISKNDEEYIFPVLLRLGREKDIGTNLTKAFYNDVLQNSPLISCISREPSLIDASYGQLWFMNWEDSHTQTTFIKNLINHGISQHRSQNISTEEFRELLSYLKKYLSSIFSFTYEDLWDTPTMYDVSQYISSKLFDKNIRGFEKNKVWMLLKSFAAWWWYKEIEELRNNWQEMLLWLKTELSKHGIIITENEDQWEIWYTDDAKIFSGTMSIKLPDGNFSCKIEYRLKSMRSILLKMWENEEYTNIDALRDIIGVAVIWPDDTSEQTKIEIMSAFAQVMPQKGYLLKNKWLLKPEAIKILLQKLTTQNKEPLGRISNSKKGKSNEDFTNASESGFIRINDSVTGFEVQFFDETGYNFWKRDHYTYDPLKVISAASRGNWFITPHQALLAIQKEIPDTVLQQVNQTPQQILYSYIEKGQLIAYVWIASWAVYISPKDHSKNFFENTKNEEIRKISLRKNSKSTQWSWQEKHIRSDKFQEFIFQLKIPTDAIAST